MTDGGQSRPTGSAKARNMHEPMGWSEFRASLENLDLVQRDREGSFRSHVRDGSLGDLRIRKVGSSGLAMRGERTPSRISVHQEELFWVCLLLTGDMRITQQGATAELRPGDFVIVDAVRPYVFDVPAAPTDTLWIGAPRTLAAGHIWDVDEMLGRRFDGGNGVGAVASRVLRGAFADYDMISGPAANRMAQGLMGVLAGAAEQYRLQDAGSPYRHAIARRIKAYIESRLDDETLTVARIASDQGLSTRYLAKLFEAEAQTVSGWIWNRRLERCHAALIAFDGTRTIADIAYANGFKNVSHFSRAFRDRYSLSPRSVAHSRTRLQ